MYGNKFFKGIYMSEISIEYLKEKLAEAEYIIKGQNVMLDKAINNYERLYNISQENEFRNKKDAIIQFVLNCDLVFEQKKLSLDQDDVELIASDMLNVLDVSAIEKGIVL